MLHRNLRGHRHHSHPLPHGMASLSLDEEIAFPGVVVGRRNRQSVEISALDVFLDPVAVQMPMEKSAKRSRIEQRSGMASPRNCSEGQIEHPGQGILRLRQKATVKNLGRLERSPSLCKKLGRKSKIVAARGQTSAIDRSRGSASYDGKRIAFGLNALQLADALEHAGLVSATCPAARHDQTDRVCHTAHSTSLFPPSL